VGFCGFLGIVMPIASTTWYWTEVRATINQLDQRAFGNGSPQATR